MEEGYQKPHGIVAGIAILDLTATVETEFHFLVDDLGVDEELLDSQWLQHTIHTFYPALTIEQIGQIIQHVGWH